MSPTTDPVAELRAAVSAAAAELSGNGATATFSFDRPPKPEFGDYSTNAAMLLAPTMGEQPRAVAERLGGLVEQRLSDGIDKVDVAGPRSEEHTSELQSRFDLVCRLLLEKKKISFYNPLC